MVKIKRKPRRLITGPKSKVIGLNYGKRSGQPARTFFKYYPSRIVYNTFRPKSTRSRALAVVRYRRTYPKKLLKKYARSAGKF